MQSQCNCIVISIVECEVADLRKGYRAFYAALETSRDLICQGTRVAECDVTLVRAIAG